MAYWEIYRYAIFFSVLLHSSSGDLVNNRGREFIVSFLPQHPQIPYNGTDRLYVSSVENTNVRVQVPFLTIDVNYDVTAGGMRIISLPGSARADGFTGKEKKGIRISSDKPFSVFGLEVLRYSGEGFLGLPTDFLGTEYMVPTYPPAINAIAQVVAGEDNTLVLFGLRLPPHGRVQYGENDYYNGDYINITLDEMEIFHVMADADLSGTRIWSSKPIALFSGNDCAVLPSLPCNHFVEQIPPISSWGTEFVTMPVVSSSAGDTYHVLAAMDSTLVHVDGQWKTVLKEGDTYNFSALSNSSYVIATSNPSLVIHYHKGQSPDRSPFMALVPPTTWYSNDYTISVPEDEHGNPFDSSADIVIDTRNRDGVRMRGGSTQQITWELIPGSGYSRTSLRFSKAHVFHVFHVNPLVNFSLLFQGRASRKWFGFPAGLKLLRANSSCSTTATKGGDQIDNDCDGRSDEELANDLDDDGDGRIDEDLATPVPILQIPKNISETPLVSCDSSLDIANPTRTGYASGSARGVCKLRGKATKSRHDKVGNIQNCIKDFDRVWELRDGCQNVIRKPQRIRIRRTQIPTIIFPDDLTMTCRDSKYMQPFLTGEVQVTADSCPRRTTVSSSDTQSDCANSEGKLTRSWTVVDECGKRTTHVQIIKLLPNWSRQTNNYLVSFRLLNVQFSADLETPASALFKMMATNLDHEVKEIFLFSKFGRLFVAAHVVDFRNGSVVPRMLVKVDVLAKVDQRQLADFMNSSLRNGTLGDYQVDPSSVRIEDFDECLAPDMNNCHEKAICTNTLGSFLCTCQEGYSGNGTVCQIPPTIFYHDPAIQAGTDENVTLTCRASGIPAPEFKWKTPQGTVNSTSWIYEMEVLDDDSVRTRGKILQDDGSLLVFTSRVSDQGLYECVAFNLLGSDVKGINLTIRKDIVEVDASLTIKNRKFDKDLEDKTSNRYQAMKKEIEDELTPLFSDVDGFERVDILGFTNGSVKVKFRVVVKVDKAEDKKPEVIATKVGNRLKVSVKDGRVGNLTVEPTIELNEIPPPPVDVKASDITQTEAVITWSHPELHGMFAITGYKLQFKKFATEKWMTSATATGQEHMLNDLEHGTAYVVRLKSINDLGAGEPSENLELLTLKKRNSATLVLAILLPILLLIILAIAAFFVYKRWKKKKTKKYQTREAVPLNPLTPEQTQAETSNGGFITFGSGRYAPIPGVNPDGATGIQIEASFSWREIPRDRVILGKILGEGEFGMVVKGEFTDDDGTKMPCAAKKLKRTATESDLKDLLNELEILTSVGNHPNLVNLIGACSVGGPLMVLVEFAENGNLLQHLRQHRTQNYEDMNEYTLAISSSDRLRIAHDVSNGMKHLAKMKCAHRDLAARNVLLGKGLVAKVSDFGLSRDIYRDDVYEKKTAGKLPAKWMAMEALEFGINTSQSDVWSFGVLLWEIETGGCVPYPGMVLNELLSRLKQGHRLEKPRYSSDWLYSLMRRCWNANPKERPTFEDISDELHHMLTQETEYLTPEDYRLEPEYQNATVENASSA